MPQTAYRPFVPANHREVAKRWVDGAQLQVRIPGQWHTRNENMSPRARVDTWTDVVDPPNFFENWEYRVKPRLVTKYQWLYRSRGAPRWNISRDHYQTEELFRASRAGGTADNMECKAILETLVEGFED